MGMRICFSKKGVCSNDYVALSVLIPVVRGIISEQSHNTRGVQPNNCTVVDLWMYE